MTKTLLKYTAGFIKIFQIFTNFANSLKLHPSKHFFKLFPTIPKAPRIPKKSNEYDTHINQLMSHLIDPEFIQLATNQIKSL